MNLFEQMPVMSEKKPAETDYDSEARNLLEEIPNEISARLEEELDNCGTEAETLQIYEKIRNVLEKRDSLSAHHATAEQEKALENINHSEYKAATEAIRKIINDKEKSIGKGNVGEVFAFGDGLCCKYIYNLGLHWGQNNLPHEMKIQKEAYEISKDDYVIVPQPRLDSIIDGHPVLIMERIDGLTLRECVEKNELPENFDPEKFFNSISEFINKMSDTGIHHRDLHGGNIMIEKETGRPAIIDFGLSKLGISGISDEDYREFDPKTRKETIFKNDQEAIKNLRAKYSPLFNKILRSLDTRQISA